MVGAIYGSETTMIQKALFSVQRKNACFNSSFIFTMLKMTYNFRNCEVAFILDCYQYSCCNQQLIRYVCILLAYIMVKLIKGGNYCPSQAKHHFSGISQVDRK